MKLEEKIRYKKIEYLSETYDKSLSLFINNRREYGNPPIFIFGSGRNGSTLMASVLNNHSRIFIPSENTIIPFAIRYWHLNPFKSWEVKLKRIFKELEKPSIWKIDFTDLKSRLKSTINENRNIYYILHEIYCEYGMKHKANLDIIWGDKTPSNTVFLHIIKKQFVDSKIIFLLRDPRAVISSSILFNTKQNIDRLDHLIWRWKCSLKKYEEIKYRDSNSIMLVKYEEFVQKPKKQIKEIMNWMGLEFEHNMLDNTERNMSLLGVQNTKHHQNLRNKITSSYIDKWKSNLSEDIVSHIEKKLTKEMKSQNYA
jgi:hypothetical protein